MNDTVTASSSIGLLVLGGGSGTIANCILADNNASLIADTPSATAWTSDYNAISGTVGTWAPAPPIHNAYEWYGATKQDRHSVYVAPVFVSATGGDYHISGAVSWPGGLPGASVGHVVLFPGETVNGQMAARYDRDGNRFRDRAGTMSCGAYDYPDPLATGAWTALAAKVPKGVRASAGVYKTGSVKAHPTLVRTLVSDAAGVSELWWDGRDDYGRAVAAGSYQVIAVSHDAKLVDDGAIANDGDPKGQYANYNAERVTPLKDGGFFVTQSYSESGYNVRRYDAAGHSLSASAQSDAGYWATSLYGDGIIAGLDQGADSKLVMLTLDGERAKMPNGTDSYRVLTDVDKGATLKGLAVMGDRAYVSLMGTNVVRVIDLKTGGKVADWPVPALGDITAAPDGRQLAAISGTNIVSLNVNTGAANETMASGLIEPEWLTIGAGRMAVVDTNHGKIAIIGENQDKPRVLGQDRTNYFMLVAGDLFRDPRGACFLADGRMVVTEFGRLRILNVDDPKQFKEIVSDFVDVGIVHPTDPRFVYTGLGIFQVDQQTGAWKWAVEVPSFSLGAKAPADDPWHDQRYAPARTVVLAGRPYLVSHLDATARFYDVSDPLKPRLATSVPHIADVYETLAFDKTGDIIFQGTGTLGARMIPFGGLDGSHNPIYDATKMVKLGPDDDPDKDRGMKNIWAMTGDGATNDLYYLAVSKNRNKMVPGWGADGTGVGKIAPDGTPLWYSPSSGGNYMSISAVNDGKQTWVLACKSFGGQTDVYNADGLRLTTGNWDQITQYQAGFVDVRYGIDGYLRLDGKVGGYVEDDAIGRLLRWRLDGGATINRQVSAITWSPSATSTETALPDSARPDAAAAISTASIPKIAAIPIDGDWSKWGDAQPQIILLPGNITFRRTIPADLFQTFRQATAIGALAHDDANVYIFFVVANDNPHYDQVSAGDLWRTDSIELWLEEEQFGFGILSNGSAGAFKYRFHDRAGTQWKAGYALPHEDVWASKIDDLSTNPLGRQLGLIAGVSMAGRTGYAVEAKIPYEEIKLVGGIAGRNGTDILPTTGKPGEIIRVGVALDKINATGRVQDYMTSWPVSLMYSDPTRSYPFSFGE